MEEDTRTKGWVLGHLFGARIVLHPTTLLLVALIALLLTSGDSRADSTSSLIRGLVVAVCLIGSILVHEIGHAAAGRLFGQRAKEIVVTLVGGHTEFDARHPTPLSSGVIAAAGPLSNLVLAAAVFPLRDLDVSPIGETALRSILVVNLVLAVFNALPGTPLDGGRILESVVWGMTGRRTTGMKAAAWGGRAVAASYLGYVLAVTTRNPGGLDLVPLVWAFLIFSILWPAAGASLRAARALSAVEGVLVATVMRGAVGIPFDTALGDALDRCRASECDEVVVLAPDGSPAGHFSLITAGDVPPDRIPRTELSALTVPLPPEAVVAPDLDGIGLLQETRRWWGKADALIVVDEGEVVGVVRLAEFTELLKPASPRP